MSALRHNDQFRAAAFAHESKCDCCGDNRFGNLIDQYQNDPAKVAEADSWTDGNQSGEHYSELESAMADLHVMHPSDLLGSDLLVRLYRLAKVHGEARMAQFEEMARREMES